MHPAHIRGRPDFYFPIQQLAIFVDGCFWHGCATCGHTPRTRSKFWAAKFERNQARDLANGTALNEAGVGVLRIWEHELKTVQGKIEVVGHIRQALKAAKAAESLRLPR